jgi:hypothetical protein
MKSRCYNPRAKSYKDYGGKGITICNRWLKALDDFAADMGPWPGPDSVVARRNLSQGFTPRNCYWSTKKEQRARRTRKITHAGKTQSVMAWAAELGISMQAMWLRVKHCEASGKPVEDAITKTYRPGRPRSQK